MIASLLTQLKDKPLEKEKDPFRLPIQYLDDVHVLNEVVASDLELTVFVPADTKEPKELKEKDETGKREITMYHYLLNPKTKFEENLIPLWKNHYTTNSAFLKESQEVVQSVKSIPVSSPDYEQVKKIWKDTKEDPHFLDRYSYMEIEMFRWVNNSPAFLQAISMINMGSPIFSFIVPVILFFMPFFIVRMQGHPITFSLYFSVLRDISRNHFIGKMLQNTSMNLQGIIYLVILGGLYAYQIYQNYMACVKFYSNISKINEQICQMQNYLSYTTQAMESFSDVIKGYSSYSGFRQDLEMNRAALVQLEERIKGVRPFKPSFSKIGEIGSLLRCYYELHSDREYGTALLYSFSFHGYLQNLVGLLENLENGCVGCAEFVSSAKAVEGGDRLVIKEQYYPALIHDAYVTNSADLTKNMVITGPNAAGKTTFLKTTMLNVIFTQQFGMGFYKECRIRPYTHIHSYLNIPDTSGRDSLFQAESRRCKEIIDSVISTDDDARHFGIFDELYSGTNPAEATKSAFAFLLWLSKRDNVDFILTTHYVDICSQWKKSGARIANWKMDAEEYESGDIRYTYRLVRGISRVQGAIKVLRDMEYPAEILETITEYDMPVEDTEVTEVIADEKEHVNVEEDHGEAIEMIEE